MRPTTVLYALFAGTAARLILHLLPPFRRPRRRLRPPPTTSQDTTSTSTSTPPPTVAAQLDLRAPPISGRQYRRSNPSVLPTECTFCLEAIRPTKHELLRQTPCNHVFHSSCLERWVFYTASLCLDWTQYSLSDDGSIVSRVRTPTCPNCTQDLDVLPQQLVQKVILTSIARSLSLRDLATAAEMYATGIVFQAPRTPPHPPSAPSSPPTRQENVRLPSLTAGRADAAGGVATGPPFARRSDSMRSEASLPPVAFVYREESGLRLVRRSEFTVSASIARDGGRGGGLLRERHGARRRAVEVGETRVVLPAIS